MSTSSTKQKKWLKRRGESHKDKGDGGGLTILKVVSEEFGVKELYVTKLCVNDCAVTQLCVQYCACDKVVCERLCMTKLCVKDCVCDKVVCVTKLYMKELCVCV